jgi:hypothetical protein
VDELVNVGYPCSSYDFFICCFWPYLADVFHYRPVVEPSVLQYHPEHLAQIMLGKFPDVVFIYQNYPILDIVKTLIQSLIPEKWR